jgi:hypothetical protein
MRTLLILIVSLMPALAMAEVPAAPADAYTVSADQWAQQRSGSALLKLQPLHDAVAAWLAQPGTRIVIRHAASDAGNLWAGELSDWLVSLGIPAGHIERRSDADQPDDSVTLLVQRG